MKKRYPFKQKLRIYIVFAVITIIALSCITVNCLRLTQTGDLTSLNRPLDIFAICIMAVVEAAMILITFASGYTLKEKCFCYFLGVFYSSVPYEDICLVRYDKKKDIFLVYYKVDKNGIVKDEASGIQAKFVRVNVSTKYFDEIAEKIKKRNPHCVVQITDQEEEEQ